MSEEKAKYRVLRLSHIHNQLWEEGAEVEYDGEPGSALEPINATAKSARQKADQKRGKPMKVATPADNKVKDDDDDDSGAHSEELSTLRQQYEELFNEKPGNMKAETLKDRIAQKRKELGV